MTITAIAVDDTDYDTGATLGDLTPREGDILMRIATGSSNREIAQDLFLSINSVKTYVRGAYRKIGVSSRSRAIIWCYETGLVNVGQPPAS